VLVNSKRDEWQHLTTGDKIDKASVAQVVNNIERSDITANLPAQVGFEDILSALNNLRVTKRVGKQDATSPGTKRIVIGGSTESSQHSFNEDEKEGFVNHINFALGGDKDLGNRIPIDAGTMALFDEVSDGLVLSKLINDSQPGTIDERVLNRGSKLSIYQKTENQNVVINSAKGLGLSVVNIGANDLIEGKPHLVLGLVWQIIRAGLVAKIDLKLHPELFRLLNEGETIEDLIKLPAEQILIRWVNYHLKKSGTTRRLTNFTTDVKDSEVYTLLLNQLAPSQCDKSPLKVSDLTERAEKVLENADKIDCRRFLTSKAIVNGNPKLNFAFTANLFNKLPGLEPLTEAEKASLDEWLFGSEGDREARAFSLWMNSLGVEPFVRNLYQDLRDGTILLQTFDKLNPGSVNWKKASVSPTSRFKQIENTNYAVDLGKQNDYKLVNVGGTDITDGNKIIMLGLVWQLMRDHVTRTLKSISKGGKDITDAEMVQWANDTVKKGGKSTTIASFRDSSLRTGVFLLDMLNGMQKGVVDYSLVTPGSSDEDAKNNAKYAISVARKLGASTYCSSNSGTRKANDAAIFLLPEDILDVKPKLITTFVAACMSCQI